MRRADPRGYSLVELVFVAALISTLTAAAIPESLTAIDEFRTSGAARYIAARMARARMDAVARSGNVAIRFVPRGSDTSMPSTSTAIATAFSAATFSGASTARSCLPNGWPTSFQA